jgi:hypothetical protein
LKLVTGNQSTVVICRFVIAMIFAAIAPNLTAAKVRSYTIVAGQERLFAYSGGLIGESVSARLRGSFDVEIAEDGGCRLTRFDVNTFDALDQGLFQLGPSHAWPDGTSLADILFVNPAGLTGRRDGPTIILGAPRLGPIDQQTLTGIQIHDLLSITPGIEDGTPNTIIRIKELDPGWADVSISSLPEFFFDSPSFNTQAPGLLASVVPEPGQSVLLTTSLIVALGGSIRRRGSCRQA